MTEPGLPSADDLRWARMARELPFAELDAVRRQAEQWRNAIGGLTALLGFAALLRGRNDLTTVPPGWRIATASVLAAAFLVLLVSFALAAYASFGRPGVVVRASGASFRRWSTARARQIGRLVPVAVLLAGLGIVLTAVAVGLTWFAPAAEPDRRYAVRSASGDACGDLVGVADGRLVLMVKLGGRTVPWSAPLADVRAMDRVVSC
jgi:hypothetical protein